MQTINIQQAEQVVINLLKANDATQNKFGGNGVPLIPFMKAGPGC